MKKKITVMYGGPGEEHEVSLNSAKNIIENIDLKKYDLNSIFIDKEGEWVLNKDIKNKREIFKKIKDSLVLSVIHGTYGEDGKLQKILENKGVKYIGSNSNVSKTTMSKSSTQKILEENGIKYPKSIVLTKYRKEINLNFPIIIKPDGGGSSFGLVKLENKEEFEDNVKVLIKKYKKVLVQEFVTGREFTCGVLDIKNKSVPLAVTEIVLTKTKMFDYEAKYTKGACLEITPAKIDTTLTKKLQQLAKKVHILTGCKDISRTDMIMDQKNNPIVLEINTAPGMTQTSFIPAQLSAEGISMSKFIDILIKNHSL